MSKYLSLQLSAFLIYLVWKDCKRTICFPSFWPDFSSWVVKSVKKKKTGLSLCCEIFPAVRSGHKIWNSPPLSLFLLWKLHASSAKLQPELRISMQQMNHTTWELKGDGNKKKKKPFTDCCIRRLREVLDWLFGCAVVLQLVVRTWPHLFVTQTLVRPIMTATLPLRQASLL